MREGAHYRPKEVVWLAFGAPKLQQCFFANVTSELVLGDGHKLKVGSLVFVGDRRKEPLDVVSTSTRSRSENQHLVINIGEGVPLVLLQLISALSTTFSDSRGE